MGCLTFEVWVEGDRATALDKRDEIIDVLEDHGFYLVLTENGLRIVMSESKKSGDEIEQ